MAEIHRFSSRRQRLDHSFLANRLKDAKSYKRIARYLRSSIFELVGEEIADIPHVQIVCNSELDAADVVVSKHVRETALKERWKETPAEVEALLPKDRYRRLHNLLTSGRGEIRVVPKDRASSTAKPALLRQRTARKTASSVRSTKPGVPLPTTTRFSGRIRHPRASRGWKRSLRHSGRSRFPSPMLSLRTSSVLQSASRCASKR
jgi:hypothetical protein